MLALSREQELTALKRRADILGVPYSPNIGLDTLRDRINIKLTEEQVDQEENPEAELEEATEQSPEMIDLDVTAPKRPLTKMEERQIAKNEQLKLVRIRISNMNPAKKDLPGEIITVGNELVGTIRKYVPYGEGSEGGWHVPYIIYKQLKSKRFLNIRVRKDPRTGRDRIEQGMVLENAIEILTPLTQKELDNLAKAQLAAGSVDAGETSVL